MFRSTRFVARGKYSELQTFGQERSEKGEINAMGERFIGGKRWPDGRGSSLAIMSNLQFLYLEKHST